MKGGGKQKIKSTDGVGVFIKKKNKKLVPLPYRAQVFNPSTWKAETGILTYIASFRPAGTALWDCSTPTQNKLKSSMIRPFSKVRIGS